MDVEMVAEAAGAELSEHEILEDRERGGHREAGFSGELEERVEENLEGESEFQ